MKETMEQHQQKLEEKQAACLEQIREMEKKVTRRSPRRSADGWVPGWEKVLLQELPVRMPGEGANHP
jgi:hypothetical protein